MKSLPARIYVCPECSYISEYRWVLANHLRNVHDYYKQDAVTVAAENEYWANPHYCRAKDLLDDD